MSELDLTAAESKAAYEEIKQYVLDKNGLKVSSLNIAQIKTKCGIIERENYNKSKKMANHLAHGYIFYIGPLLTHYR